MSTHNVDSTLGYEQFDRARKAAEKKAAPVVYLAGPINGCTDAEANDWRTYIKQNHDGETLDPMRRDYRTRELESAAEAIAIDTEIVELDKADIEACGVFLAYCPHPSYGTAMEILYAWEAYKPSVVVVPAGQSVSPWIRYHATRVVPTLDEALAAIAQVSA